MLFSILLSTAIASDCIADVCLNANPTGFGFDGITIMADITFGWTKEFGRHVSLPMVIPRVAIGGTIATELPGKNARIPLMTPYIGFSPVVWSDFRERPISSLTGFLGVNVLGFGDIGIATAWHDQMPAWNLDSSVSMEAGDISADIKDSAWCSQIIENWEGWNPQELAMAKEIWSYAVSDIPFPSDEYATAKVELASSCVGADHAKIVGFVDAFNLKLNRTVEDAWKSGVQSDGFFYVSLTTATGVRSLLQVVGQNQPTAAE